MHKLIRLLGFPNNIYFNKKNEANFSYTENSDSINVTMIEKMEQTILYDQI